MHRAQYRLLDPALNYLKHQKVPDPKTGLHLLFDIKFTTLLWDTEAIAVHKGMMQSLGGAIVTNDKMLYAFRTKINRSLTDTRVAE